VVYMRWPCTLIRPMSG